MKLQLKAAIVEVGEDVCEWEAWKLESVCAGPTLDLDVEVKNSFSDLIYPLTYTLARTV
jgi:hypothetical protein